MLFRSLLIAGDMNLTEKHTKKRQGVFNDFLQRMNLRIVKTNKNTHFNKYRGSSETDFALVSPGVEIGSIGIVDDDMVPSNVSDHLPINIEIKYKTNRAYIETLNKKVGADSKRLDSGKDGIMSKAKKVKDWSQVDIPKYKCMMSKIGRAHV